jgi:hypothetical protein
MKRTLMEFSMMVIICMLLASCGTGSPGVPFAPAVNATAGDGQVTISLVEVVPWAPTVDSYTVYFSTTDPVTTSSTTRVTGIIGSSTTITGLTNGTMYYFIGTSVNADDESPPSSEVRAMPDINIGTVTILDSASGLLGYPQSIAVDSTSVYWTEDIGTPWGGGSGAVKKVGLNGGIVTTLDSGPTIWQDGGPQSIVVDSTNAYWADYYSGTINKVLISGGSVTTIASGLNSPQSLAIDSTNVYWANGAGISKVGINGGTVTTLASGTINPYAIAIDSANVYWTGYTNTNSVTINKVGLNGGTITTLASELSGCPRGIAVDSTSVYWTDMCNWTVNKVGINGGTVTTLASGTYTGALNGPYGIAVDSTSVYWTEFNESGSIYKVGINGGTFTTVASGLNMPANIAIDSTNVYWTEFGYSIFGGGTVKKVSK